MLACARVCARARFVHRLRVCARKLEEQNQRVLFYTCTCTRAFCISTYALRIHAHTQSPTHSCMHARAHTHVHARSLSHESMHACTHTRTHAHTHACTHNRSFCRQIASRWSISNVCFNAPVTIPCRCVCVCVCVYSSIIE